MKTSMSASNGALNSEIKEIYEYNINRRKKHGEAASVDKQFAFDSRVKLVE
jgi:hypothetical protein